MSRKGGLYVIRLSPVHFYGGRAVDFKARWAKHLNALLEGTHYNQYMQRVFNLHGKFEPEIVLELSTLTDQIEAEREWLDDNFRSPGCVNVSPVSNGGPQNIGFIWVNFEGGRPKVIDPKLLPTYEADGWVRGVPDYLKGLIWLRSADSSERCRVRPEELSKYLDEGWLRGYGYFPPRYWIHRVVGEETERRRIAEEQIPVYLQRGWKVGSALPNVKGLLWVYRVETDGSSLQRRILEEDVDFFLDEGWTLGQERFTKDLVWIRKERGEEEGWEFKRVPSDSLSAWLEKGWERGFREHTEEHRSKMRESWTPERREAFRQRVLANPIPPPNPSARKRAGRKLSAQRKGVSLSDEHRRTLSEAQRKRWEREGGPSEEMRKQIGEKARKRFAENPEAWATSDEKRRKVSANSRGRVWVNNGTENRFVSSEEAETFLETGWEPGRKGRKAPPEIRNTKLSESKKGRVWVNDGTTSRMVSREEADSLLLSPGNWALGRGR